MCRKRTGVNEEICRRRALRLSHRAGSVVDVDLGPLLVPDPVIEAYRAGVDRSLIRENLRLTPEQRLLKLMELQRLAEELRKAGRKARGG